MCLCAHTRRWVSGYIPRHCGLMCGVCDDDDDVNDDDY